MAGCVLFPESESLSSWISGEAGTTCPVWATGTRSVRPHALPSRHRRALKPRPFVFFVGALSLGACLSHLKYEHLGSQLFAYSRFSRTRVCYRLALRPTRLHRR